MKKSSKTATVKPKKNPKEKVKALQSFLSCLFYLIQEAKREDLTFVANVLKEGIGKIDRLSNCDELRQASANIIDNSLFEAMNFLHTLSSLSVEQRTDYMRVFEMLRQTLHIGSSPNEVEKPPRFGLLLQ
jgi:hypothetical protein